MSESMDIPATAAPRLHALCVEVERLRHLANHDELTGLPVRARLAERLEASTERARSGGTGGAVIFLDLDRFKHVNDCFGHCAGDRLLIGVAGRIRAAIAGTGDHVASRLGGDEFVVFLDQADRADAEATALALRRALAPPHAIDGHDIACTASLGIAIVDGSRASALEALRDADIAMYHAKKRGTGIAVFDEEMRRDIIVRLERERELRRAVSDLDFELIYEPIVSLDSGAFVGFEAVAVCRAPALRKLSRETVAALAEEAGLTPVLGAWAIAEACAARRRWCEVAPAAAALSLHVDVTRRQLLDPDVVPQIRRILDGTGTPPSALTLELSEGVIVTHHRDVAPVLAALRAERIDLCMDRFGTGDSALSRLPHMPIDYLKMDREFSRDPGRGIAYAAVVQAIVTLAHTAGMTVVAEGVENEGQVALLQALDCDRAQGPHFGRPLDAAGVARILKKATTRIGHPSRAA